MLSVAAPRFDLVECNTEQEREFIAALHLRAVAGNWYADSWLRTNRLIIAVYPLERTLRVDFDGTTIIFGDDETHQFVTDLDSAKGATVVKGKPIAELAEIAADWIERETWRTRASHVVSAVIVAIAAVGLIAMLFVKLGKLALWTIQSLGVFG